MTISSITNFIQVSERIASSGQPEDKQFKLIASKDYRAVINLAMPNSDHAIPEEGNIVTALNMLYVHIPVPFEAPDITHLQNFINVIRALSEQKVWIHCVANYRVSAFLFQYWRIENKASIEEARKVMLPSWQPNEVWQQFMGIESNAIM